MPKLKWSKANAKTRELAYSHRSITQHLDGGRKVYNFDLPADKSCPFADRCKSRAVVGRDGKRHIKDGPNTEHRCFAASQEVLYTNTYELRRHNYALLKQHSNSCGDMQELLQSSIPDNAGVIRIHSSGDFFNENHMLAWIKLAQANRNRLFYAYTKSTPYWISLRSEIPANLVLTASYGGRVDELIDLENLRYSKVVFSEQQATHYGLPIDHDDSHAANPNPKARNEPFATLLHGVQPKGSAASVALRKLKGVGSYSRKS